MKTIRTEPLTKEAFAPYGWVISGDRGDIVGKSANQGTATRFNWLGAVEDLRPGKSRLNLCLFRCSPRTGWPLRVEILERHPMTTQVIVPMNADQYVVLVGLRTDGSDPDLSSLRAARGRRIPPGHVAPPAPRARSRDGLHLARLGGRRAGRL
jgi:ureidoglycolate lyase